MNILKTIFFFIFTSSLFINQVSGITLTVNPENPVAGDEITIQGIASPNQVLQPSISFKKTVTVANGKYYYNLNGVSIPSGENSFNVKAENTKNINVRVKIFIWLTLSAEGNNGISTISQANVPKGTYDIKIDGDSVDGTSFVPLIITASSKINADPQGNFEYKYSTSGVPPGTFTLNIGGITRTISLLESRPAESPPPSGSGGSGDGGGSVSDENYSNIEVKEKYDMYIFKDRVTSYKFANRSNPITYVNITGNINAGEVNAAVEVLKNTSTLLKRSAPGNVYKNMNIWVGTSGFAVPANIKEAVIMFRIDNSWITSKNIDKNNIKMVRWDGEKWIQLETAQKTTESSYTYYEAKTDAFSSFAIIGIKDAAGQDVKPNIDLVYETATTGSKLITPISTMSEPASTFRGMPGYEITLALTALIVLILLFKRINE